MIRKKQDGAIVVEATLSLAFFMFLITAILTMVNVCYSQAQMGMLVNGIAKDISNYTYIYTMTDANAKKAELSNKASYANYTVTDVMDNSKKVMDRVETLANAAIDKEFWSSMGSLLLEGGVSYGESWALDKVCRLAAKKRITPNGEDTNAYLKRLGIEGGLDGLSFMKSEFCPGGTDDIKIVVSYKAHMVDFFGLDLNFNLEQTALTKAWCATKPSVYRNTSNGSDTEESSGSESDGEKETEGNEGSETTEDEEKTSNVAAGEEEEEVEEEEKSAYEWARDSTHNPSSDSVCLGRYVDDYTGVAEEFGFTYYSMDESDYNRLKEEKGLDYCWEINKQFLLNQEYQGKTFYLATSPYNVDVKSTYYMEVEWLESRGYTFEYNPGVGLWKAVRK